MLYSFKFVSCFRLILNLLLQVCGILLVSSSVLELENSKSEFFYKIRIFISFVCGLIILLIKSIEFLDNQSILKINIPLFGILIPLQLFCFCWNSIDFKTRNIKIITLSSIFAFLIQIILMSTKISEKYFLEMENFSASAHLSLEDTRELFRLNKIKQLKYSHELRKIQKYFDNGWVHDFDKYITINKCYKVIREDHIKRFNDNNFRDDNVLLLWHGTKIENIKGILKEGFKLPDHNNGMFGRGIYFADRMSKSAGYCNQIDSGILLLCNVALGKKYEANKSQKFNQPPDGYDSVLGVGRFVADPDKIKEFEEGVKIPTGKTKVKNEIQKVSLKYNEYIVYDPARIIIKYIVKFKWYSK